MGTLASPEVDDWTPIPPPQAKPQAPAPQAAAPVDDWTTVPPPGQPASEEPATLPTDDEQPPATLGDLAVDTGIAGLKGAGHMIGGGLGWLQDKIDSYTMGPVRTMRERLMQTHDKGNAIMAGLKSIGDEPNTRPSGGDFMESFGIPNEAKDKISLPLNISPTGEKLKLTPAELSYAAVSTAADPVSGLGPLGAEWGAMKLGEMAALRGVKAATRESLADLKNIAKMGRGSRNSYRIDALTGERIPFGPRENILKVGTAMRMADEAGPPIYGPGDSALAVGLKAEQKRQYYGAKIGMVGDVIDHYMPGSINTEAIAQRIRDYADKVEPFGQTGPVKAELYRQADMWDHLHATGEDVGFKRAQNIKQGYSWKAASPDALISNIDATNMLNDIVTSEMDKAAEVFVDHPSPGQLTTKARANPGTAVAVPTPPHKALVAQYKNYRDSYGMYKDLAEAGTNASVKQSARRVISPSSYGTGAVAGLMGSPGHAAQAVGRIATGVLGNQFLLNRGSAIGGRVAGGIANVIEGKGANLVSGINRAAKAVTPNFIAESRAAQLVSKYPKLFEKWLPGLTRAGVQTIPADFSAHHHMLMQTDPEYQDKLRMVDKLDPATRAAYDEEQQAEVPRQ